MRLIEVRGTVIELLVWATVENIRGVVVGVIQGFGPRVRNAKLEVTCIPPIDLHLQAVVVRATAVHDRVDIAEPAIAAQEIVAESVSRHRVFILGMAKIRNRAVDQSCAIGNSIQISFLAQVSAE